MRTSLYALPLLLAACASELTYQTDYQDVWCQVAFDRCPTADVPDMCRPTGAPIDEDPTLPNCSFDGFAGWQCLTSANWGCETVDGEAEVDVPPSCARVWVCDDDA